MNYIYTYYSFGGKYVPSSLFMKMATISVASLRSVTKGKIELYTDKESVSYFHGIFGAEEIIVCDYSHFNIDSRYWNFAKILTYDQQFFPFLHVDFDTFFMPDFSVPDADIVTEKIRDYSYSRRIAKHGYTNLARPTSLICSGLIGCRSDKALQLFHQNADHAVQRCRKSLLVGDLERISIEEYAFSQLAEQTDLVVRELDKRYFAHWQGGNKEERFGKIIDMLYKQF